MTLKDLIAQESRLRYFATSETVIVMRTPIATFKVARVTFGKDGSIYVQFPYCIEKTGIVAELSTASATPAERTYRLGDVGEFVDTDVKFSHHLSGIAQFSKGGLHAKLPRRQSFPLDGPIGHLFRLQVMWLDRFEVLKNPKNGVAYLGFDFPEEHPTSVVVLGEWRRKVDIVNNIDDPKGIAGPATQIQERATGAIRSVYFVGQPASLPLRDHVLMISGGAVDLPQGAQRSGMVFLGGWDPHEVKHTGAVGPASDCLTFMYPATRPSPA